MVMPEPLVDAEPVVWPPPPDVPRVRYLGEVRPKASSWVRPMGVACEAGVLAVADADGGAVWTVDLARGRGKRLAPLLLPLGVALAGDRVFAVDAERALLVRARRFGWKRLLRDDVLQRPTALLALGPERLILVDTPAHQVLDVHLGPDGVVTEPMGPARGAAGEGFNFPVGIARAGDDYVVSDSMNAVVQQLKSDGSLGYVAGEPGIGGGGLVRPKGVAVDAAGQIHVVDGGLQHVQVYNTDGVLVGRYGEPGSGPGQLALPAGICIAQQRVYVADSLNARVQVYELLP